MGREKVRHYHGELFLMSDYDLEELFGIYPWSAEKLSCKMIAGYPKYGDY